MYNITSFNFFYKTSILLDIIQRKGNIYYNKQSTIIDLRGCFYESKIEPSIENAVIITTVSCVEFKTLKL